jgi:cell division protein ZapA
MSNKVTVTLDGRRYYLSAEEDTQYMYRVADFVNGQMEEVRRNDRYRSGVDCATLTALNLADTLFKERAATEDIRRQMIIALEDVRKAEQELRELKKEQKGQKSQKSSQKSKK